MTTYRHTIIDRLLDGEPVAPLTDADLAIIKAWANDPRVCNTQLTRQVLQALLAKIADLQGAP